MFIFPREFSPSRESVGGGEKNKNSKRTEKKNVTSNLHVFEEDKTIKKQTNDYPELTQYLLSLYYLANGIIIFYARSDYVKSDDTRVWMDYRIKQIRLRGFFYFSF